MRSIFKKSNNCKINRVMSSFRNLSVVMAKYKKMPVLKFNLRDWHFLIIQLQLISWPRTTLTTAVPDAKYTTNQANSYIPERIILQ